MAYPSQIRLVVSLTLKNYWESVIDIGWAESVEVYRLGGRKNGQIE